MRRLTIEIGRQVVAREFGGDLLFLRTRHEGLLLGALALAGGRELSRAALAGHLWPEMAPDRAGMNFRQRLRDLRRTVGERVDADRTAVWLKADGVTVLELPGAALDACRTMARECDFRSQRGGQAWSGTDAWEWLRATVAGERAGREPVAADWAGLMRTAEDSGRETEERLLAACLLARLQIQGVESGATQRFALAFLEAGRGREELSLPLGYLAGLAALESRRSGSPAEAFLFLTESERCFRAAQSGWALQLSALRRGRMLLDFGQSRTGYAQLCALDGAGLDHYLGPMLDLNLVFAHSLAGDYGAARTAGQRFRSGSGWDSGMLSWLLLNESFLHCRQGQLRQAAETILEASRVLDAPLKPLDAVWHWTQAMEVFSRMGAGYQAAVTDTLVRRSWRMMSEGATPMVQRLYEKSLVRVVERAETRDWMAGVRAAESLDLELGQATVQEMLARVR